MKLLISHHLIIVFFILISTNFLAGQERVSIPWKAGIYIVGSVGIPKLGSTKEYTYDNSFGKSFGFGLSIRKKYFSLKTEFEQADFSGTLTRYEGSGQNRMEFQSDFNTINLYFKALAEFYPLKNAQSLFANIGPVIHFQQYKESFSELSSRRAGAEFNIGYAPTFKIVTLMVSAGISGTERYSDFNQYIFYYYKASVGVKINLQ